MALYDLIYHHGDCMICEIQLVVYHRYVQGFMRKSGSFCLMNFFEISICGIIWVPLFSSTNPESGGKLDEGRMLDLQGSAGVS